MDRLGIPTWTSLILSRPDTTWPSAETPGQRGATWHPTLLEGRRFCFTACCNRGNVAWTLHLPPRGPWAMPGNVRQASNLTTPASAQKGPWGITDLSFPPLSWLVVPHPRSHFATSPTWMRLVKEKSEQWMCDCRVAQFPGQPAALKPQGGLTALNKPTQTLNGGGAIP